MVHFAQDKFLWDFFSLKLEKFYIPTPLKRENKRECGINMKALSQH